MEVKEVLNKIVDFDVEDKFYDKKEKKEVAKAIADLLDIDDSDVRNFLKKWLEDTKDLADEMGLLSDEGDAEDGEGEEEYKPDEEEPSQEDETEPPEADDEDKKDEEDEDKKEESEKNDGTVVSETEFLQNQANRYLM